MPIRPEMKARYPADWKAISRRVRDRAGDRCERCGVPNHAVGHRDAAGRFVPLCGNLPCDLAGRGIDHETGRRLAYGRAAEIADDMNCCYRGKRRCDDAGNRWLVVVLTVAHLDPDPANCADANLIALCQACHNRMDAPMRARNAAETRRRRKAGRQPELFPESLEG